MYGTVKAGDHTLLFFHEFRLMNDHGKGIDAGRYVLEGNTILLEYLKYLAAKADFCSSSSIFFNIDRAKTFLSCHAGDRKFRLAAGALYDQRSRVLRTGLYF